MGPCGVVEHPLWRCHPASQSPGVAWLIAKARAMTSFRLSSAEMYRQSSGISADLSIRAPLHKLPKLRVREGSIYFLSGFCALKATDYNGKKPKRLSNMPSIRKVINPTPLKQRFKGRYIFYLIRFCYEIARAVTEVHISSSSSIKKECLHGLCQEEWKVERKKRKRKNIPLFPQLFLHS